MAVPQRPFRGASPPEEGQHQPIYATLDHQLDNRNAKSQAFQPLQTSFPATGGVSMLMPGNIAWWPFTVSLASSAGTQSFTLTHGLSRVPVMLLQAAVADSGLRTPFFVVDVTNWNSIAVTIGCAALAAATTVTAILL